MTADPTARYLVKWNAGSGEQERNFSDIDEARTWARTQSALTVPRTNPDGSRPPAVGEIWDTGLTPRSRVEMWLNGKQIVLPR